MMIGEGATGRVFIGVCRQSSLDVAVKIIHEQVFLLLFDRFFFCFVLFCFVVCRGPRPLWSFVFF